MDNIIIDTSAFYAFVSSTDRFHSKSKATFLDLWDKRQRLWTTSYILCETLSLILKRMGIEKVKIFIDSMKNVVNIIWITQPIHDASVKLMFQRESRLSLADCSVVIVAKELNAKVFAFDANYKAEGLFTLP